MTKSRDVSFARCSFCGKRYMRSSKSAVLLCAACRPPSSSESSGSKPKKLSVSKTKKRNIKKRNIKIGAQKTRLKVYSKRGTRINELLRCSRCGKLRHPVWRYAQSSKGPVFLCSDCKPRSSKSSRKRDALSAAIRVGYFEGSRRRH